MAFKRRVRKLNRTKSAREALLAQLALSVIEYGVIETSEARGKGLGAFFDRLMRGRGKSQDYGKKVARVLKVGREKTGKILKSLDQIGEDRKSGFLRIVRLGKRGGDDSMRVKVELIKRKVDKVVKVDQVETPVVEQSSLRGKEVEKGRDVST